MFFKITKNQFEKHTGSKNNILKNDTKYNIKLLDNFGWMWYDIDTKSNSTLLTNGGKYNASYDFKRQ